MRHCIQTAEAEDWPESLRSLMHTFLCVCVCVCVCLEPLPNMMQSEPPSRILEVSAAKMTNSTVNFLVTFLGRYNTTHAHTLTILHMYTRTHDTHLQYYTCTHAHMTHTYNTTHAHTHTHTLTKQHMCTHALTSTQTNPFKQAHSKTHTLDFVPCSVKFP